MDSSKNRKNSDQERQTESHRIPTEVIENKKMKSQHKYPSTNSASGQGSPKGSNEVRNPKKVVSQISKSMKVYYLDNLSPKNGSSTSDSFRTKSKINSTTDILNEKTTIDNSQDENRNGLRSITNRTEEKDGFGKTDGVGSKRKKQNESSFLRATKSHLAPIEKSPTRSSQTLARFIDSMILKGSLPAEATAFFSQTVKSPSQGFPKQPLTNKANIKLKPLPKIERARLTHTDDQEDPITSQNLNIIPNWMKGLSEFNEKYNMLKSKSKLPVYEILMKSPETRDEPEHNFIYKWLEKFDLFAKLPYDILIELGKRLKVTSLQEGEILCNIGDSADCLYIIYDGKIDVLVPETDGGERLIVTATSGELLGRQNLEIANKRTAKLQASEPTHVVMLYRSDYHEVAGEIRSMMKPNLIIADFVRHHGFFKQFSEVQKLQLEDAISFRKHYKNDVIYDIGSSSESFFMLISGEVTREMPITIEKANKWPTSLHTWEMYKNSITYSVKIPLENGEIFGLTEFLENKPRREKVIVEGNALVLLCPKKGFYDIFEKYQVPIFVKKAEEDEKLKQKKLAEIFDVQFKLQKIKDDAMDKVLRNSAVNHISQNYSQVEKVKEWKRAFDKLTTAAFTQKKVVDRREIHKVLNSVHET